MRNFIYADDLKLAAQPDSFQILQHFLTGRIEEFGTCCDGNQLKPKPAKTQICAFHLIN